MNDTIKISDIQSLVSFSVQFEVIHNIRKIFTENLRQRQTCIIRLCFIIILWSK